MRIVCETNWNFMCNKLVTEVVHLRRHDGRVAMARGLINQLILMGVVEEKTVIISF